MIKMSILTSRKKEFAAFTMYDSKSKMRENLLKHWFPSSIDGIRSTLHTIALIANPATPEERRKTLKRGIHYYSRYIHTNAVILPLKDIEELLEDATELYVDACPCRVIERTKNPDIKCDAPIYSCLRINYSAKIRMEQKNSIGITKEQALRLVRHANKLGLAMSLESCIQPYQCNICMCCTDCCVPMQARFKYDIPMYYSGPYLPEMKNDDCMECQACVERCPVPETKKPIRIADKKVLIDTQNCLGCGLCSQACPADVIHMVKYPERMQHNTEPSLIRLLIIYMYIHLFRMPIVKDYVAANGSWADKLANAEPRPADLLDIIAAQKNPLHLG